MMFLCWCVHMLVCILSLFFFKLKTAYEMRISDWSSDVCSSDLSGMVPYLLARKINARLLPGALELSRSGNTIAAVQFLPKGRRRRIEAAMPCVVTAHPLAPLGLKYAHANKLAGHIASTETRAGPTGQSPWTILPVEEIGRAHV